MEPWLKGERKVERGKSALSDDDRMHEFHRDVLRVRRVRPAPEGQQAAAAEKTLGHFTARFRHAARFQVEKQLERFIACQQSLFDLRRQCKTRHHRVP